MVGRLGVLIGLAISMVLVPAPGDARARAASDQRAQLDDCRERFVIVPGDEEGVRARVPARYDLARGSDGRPLLYASAIRCERYSARGTTARTLVAAFAVMIAPPDGVGCASRWPVVGDVKGDALSCNLYVLFAAYDNPAVVAWLRAGTPDLPVHHVKDLRWHEDATDLAGLTAGLRFHAGRPTPSPFDLDATVRSRPVETPFTATFWAETKAGTVRIRFETDDMALGRADGTLRAAPGTEMARLLGSETATGAPPFSLIAGNRWRAGSLTKAVLPTR